MLVIKNAKIVDGNGNPWFWGELGIDQDRIVAIGARGTLEGDETLDANGLVLAPGFIDIQSHSIVPLMRDGRSLGKVHQGVTLEVMGEGWTPAPFGGQVKQPFPQSYATTLESNWHDAARGWARFSDWLEAMEGRVSPNVASFLAGGTLREYACGMRMGAASAAELEVMREQMRQAMLDGAMGVAYALIYPPDEFCSTEEIIEVCKVVARHGGVYITHLRSEGDRFLEALEEAFSIGRESGAPVEIYHLKASGERNWSKMPQALEIIEAARDNGVDVTADMYPYPASGTGLDALLPTWVSADGKFWENLEDAALREKIKLEVLQGTGDMNTSRADRVMPIGFRLPEHQQYVGKRLSEIAESRNEDWVDAAFSLLRAEQQRIGTIYFSMAEDNLRLQIQRPWVKISTDAGGHDPATAKESTHPRAYGTFPRVLKKYVRDEKILTLEEAVQKMTGAVARRLSIPDRGRLEVGMYADLVIFDPETIADTATFDAPHQLAVGVRDVFVNGTRVLENGAHTGALPGRFVRGPGAGRSS
jgi:N-acyl-D-amino-acid deacylase